MANIIIGKDGRKIDIDKFSPKMKRFYLDTKANLKKHFGLNFDEYITSGHRTSEEDKKAGGTGHGRHVKGEGIDFNPQDNPVIYKYLWNTKEGLDSLVKADLGIFDEMEKKNHYHIGRDTYGGETKDNKERVMKAKDRMNELKADGSKDSVDKYLTVEDISIATPEYVNPEKVKEILQEKHLTPQQKQFRKRQKAIATKMQTFEEAKKEYDAVVEKGHTPTIDKAKDVLEDAYMDAFNDVESTLQYAQLEREKELKTILKEYDKDSKIYKDADKEYETLKEDLYMNKFGGQKLQTRLKTVVKTKDQLDRARRKAPKNQRGQTKRVNPDLVAATTDEKLLESYDKMNEIMPVLTGENIDFTIPEEQEKLREELEKRTADQVTVKDKEQTLLDDENKKLAKEGKVKKTVDPLEPKIAPIDTTEDERLKKEAQDHFSRFDDVQEPIIPQQFDYNEKNYPKNIPYEALMFGALGLSGMADAKTELPMRDEAVSQAMLQYTQDLKKLSEQGLKPEEEAKIKGELAGAYQQGMTDIVRASGGNRNLVLGNRHQPANALNRGILDMNILDQSIKMANFDKYGASIEKLNAFRMNTDIANHQIKLDEAKDKRISGANLASSSFAAMIEELQYQKENGPGSANHRMNKAFEVMLTGVDSEIPDDQTGNTPNTASAQRKGIAESMAAWEQRKALKTTEQSYLDGYMKLTPSERKDLPYQNYRDEQIFNKSQVEQPKVGGISSFTNIGPDTFFQ